MIEMVKKETFAVYSKKGKYIETVQRTPYKHGWIGYKGKIYALSKPPKDSRAKQAIYLDRDAPAHLTRIVKKARRPRSAATTKTTIRKVKSHQPMGKYKETSVDKQKKSADFKLLQVSPYGIQWKNGKTETVTARALKKLQKTHTWATDF